MYDLYFILMHIRKLLTCHGFFPPSSSGKLLWKLWQQLTLHCLWSLTIFLTFFKKNFASNTFSKHTLSSVKISSLTWSKHWVTTCMQSLFYYILLKKFNTIRRKHWKCQSLHHTILVNKGGEINIIHGFWNISWIQFNIFSWCLTNLNTFHTILLSEMSAQVNNKFNSLRSCGIKGFTSN